MLAVIKLLRPHQWIKNSFVWVGFLFSHRWCDVQLIKQLVCVFFAFCLVSSFVYIVNDYKDRHADSLHPNKQSRPLASGVISPVLAVIAALILLVAGAYIAWLASNTVLLLVLIYVVLNFIYTFWLKHIVIVDVFCIAAGFMLRLLVGTTGVGIEPSQWLLLCGLMFTLFLGFAKRKAELNNFNAQQIASVRPVLTHYTSALLDKFLGIAAAATLLCYSLYAVDFKTVHVHGTNKLFYTIPLVAFGLFRYLYLLSQKKVGEEPSREILKDPQLFLALFLWVVVVLVVITVR